MPVSVAEPRRSAGVRERGADHDRDEARHVDEQEHGPPPRARARVGSRGALRRRSIQPPYSVTKVWSGLGSLRSTKLANGPEARISHGVVSVVIAETATATGYRKSRVAPSEMPEPGDDERELADLREAHAGLDRGARAVAGEERADRDADDLADDHDHGERRDRARVLEHQRRIDQHADRHEEDRREHVADRRDQRARSRAASPDSATSEPAMNAPSATE